jgi:uroporphyrinogen decarboxylase
MNEMTSTERVMRVLKRQEPDRVPHFEWLVDPKVRQALCPGCKDHNDFAVRMGHDAVLVGPSFAKTQVDERRWKSEWGYVTQRTAEAHDIEVESPIQTMDDLDRYTPPEVCAPERYRSIEAAVAEFKGKKAVGVHLNDVFSLPRYLMGMQNLLLATADDPALVKALVEMSVDLNIKMAKEVAARGVDFVWTGDDYAANRGPMMAPDVFRELFYPGLRRVMGGFKEQGLPVIKHTDGNLWSIIDMIVDSGIDCLDPIDPLAGMDLGEVKEKYGHVVALKGNVDCAEAMTFGAPEDVIALTKDALRVGAPGGGFILSSSNSIHSGVKPENYKALMDTLEEYGDYPVTV